MKRELACCRGTGSDELRQRDLNQVSLDERIRGLVLGPALAAVIAGQLDRAHRSVHVDLRSQRPIARRIEETRHQLVAGWLASCLDIVEPQMRTAARAEGSLGEG